MSSNAFARSRPRVRHQRVPRNNSCDHPRFLQLVNELARLNDAKKKQEEADGVSSVADSGREDSDGGGGCNANNLSSPSCCASASSQIGWVGASCCDASGSQSSNGYRSGLDSNQSSTSALHDNYQHHNHHHHHHLHHQNQPQHMHHHNHHHQHQQPQQQNLHQDSQNIGNTLQHDERCPLKGSSTSYGGLKQNLVSVEPNGPDFSTGSNNNINSNISDLRQDENRSKRKRSANESSANSRKSSSSSCSGTNSNSKRHKSTSDAIRPLSPSFSKCPICLLDCMDRDPSFTNTCFHLFCFVCIDNWTKNKATCPLCRTKFTKIIYGIKSATQYDEKIASPIRRDDDEGYMADRLMLEHLSGLNSNSQVTSRSATNDDVQFLFENLRNPEVLMPQYFQVNQMDHRQEGSIHTFNAVTAASNFNSNVPHSPFANTSYPITQNYIALFPPNRIAPTTSAAITSAYTANTSLTNINTDPSGRRVSRSGRYSYPRNYEPQTVDGSSRVSRASNASITPAVPLERHHHHHHQHQHQHPHPNHHPHVTHSRTLDAIQRPRAEQGSHAHIQLQYPMQTRHYAPNPYPSRRPPYNNPQMEHHILDTIYRQMPDM